MASVFWLALRTIPIKLSPLIDHIYAKLWINDLSFPSIRAETVFLFTIISPAPNRLLGNRNNHNNNIKVIRIAKLYRIET